jgi:hypothetical protein
MKPPAHLETSPSCELGSQDGKFHLKIWSYAYEFPEIKSGSDADWHRNFIQIKADVFSASFDEVCLNGELLEAVLKEVEEFSALKRDSVTFEPLEPYFSLKLSFNSRKNVIVSGIVQHPVGTGPELKFEFESDLSFVDKFSSGIKAILKSFPVR